MIEPGQLVVDSRRDGDVHTIRLAGELDAATADPVTRELERVESSDVRSIVLDLAGLTFISSNGIEVLLGAQARSTADSNRLSLLPGPPAVHRVLAMSGVDGLLPFSRTR